MRLLSAEAKVPLNHIRNGQMTDDDWAKLARKMGEVSSAPMFIDDSPNMTMMEIRAKARRLKQRHDLRLIVIDYMQLMTSGKKVESRQLEVSEFSRQIKLLAKELEVPIIALSQLNRGPEQRADKRPMLSDLRESGCLTAETRLMRADTNTEVTLGELMRVGRDRRPGVVARRPAQAGAAHADPRVPVGHQAGLRAHAGLRAAGRATANHPFLTYDGWMPLARAGPAARMGSVRHVPPPLESRRATTTRSCCWRTCSARVLRQRRDPLRQSTTRPTSPRCGAAGRRFGITRGARAAVPAGRRCACPRRRLPSRRPDRRSRAWLCSACAATTSSCPTGCSACPRSRSGSSCATCGRATARSAATRRTARPRLLPSTSRRLVDDVARLLLRFNVFTRITRVRTAGYRDGWQVLRPRRGEPAALPRRDRCARRRGPSPAPALAAPLRASVGRTDLDPVPDEVWDRVRDVLVERAEAAPRVRAGRWAARSGGSTAVDADPGRETAGPGGRRARRRRARRARDQRRLLGHRHRDRAARRAATVYDATVLGHPQLRRRRHRRSTTPSSRTPTW